jgi:D-amino-acid oxidase
MSTFDKTPLHLSFERSALISPKDKALNYSERRAPHVLVIGAGIIGMSVAWTLLDSGFNVTVLAEQYATVFGDKRLTSQIAGALYVSSFYPPVYGQARLLIWI